ncbi:MAG: glutaredoxin domain-containing protein [Candidatus Woesearchaeota archaeon]|jgi:glutaredoxin-like YruB-family protein
MEVKIYTTPTCPWCKTTKEWMKKNKVSFQELDIVESDTYRDELIEKSHQMAVPMIDIDGTIIVGFDEKRLEELLKKEKK